MVYPLRESSFSTLWAISMKKSFASSGAKIPMVLVAFILRLRGGMVHVVLELVGGLDNLLPCLLGHPGITAESAGNGGRRNSGKRGNILNCDGLGNHTPQP